MSILNSELMSITSEIFLFLLGIVIITLIPLNNILINAFLLVLLLMVWLRIKNLKLTNEDLGLKPDFCATLMPWLTITTFLILAIFVGRILYPEGLFTIFAHKDRYFYTVMAFYALVGTLIQEFIFRGYVFARLKKFPTKCVILISIVLFSAIHLPHLIQLSSSLMFFSILAGIFWAAIYSKFPNLYYAWISHAVVGVTAILLLGITR